MKNPRLKPGVFIFIAKSNCIPFFQNHYRLDYLFPTNFDKFY